MHDNKVLDSHITSSMREDLTIKIQEGKTYVGAIDIGTNSTHLLIASVDLTLKTFSIELAEKSTTRLGEKEYGSGDLTDIAVTRVIKTLKRFKDIADSYKVKELITYATSAVREAPNRNNFLNLVKSEVNIDIELISGTEEARLIYLGVLSGMEFGERPHLIIDIGGGSTELILADANDAIALTSTKIGAVRLKRDFFNNKKNELRETHFLQTFIRGSLEPAVDKIRRRIKPNEKHLMIATSGTAMAIGSLIDYKHPIGKGKHHGMKISKNKLDNLVEKLINYSPDQLKKITSISDRRSEIIIPGALILQTSMRMMNIDEVVLCERALREGMVVDWMFRKGLFQSKYNFQGNIRERTVFHQAKRFMVDTKRSRRVAKHALEIYDQTFGLLHFDKGEGRNLLWAAAILHSCGQHINLAAYHKHSWYLIRHGELLGYSRGEHLMVAGIARYHRKSFPKKRHEAWQCLITKEQKEIVAKMSIILRLAKSIDKRPDPAVDKIRVDNSKTGLKLKLVPEISNQNIDLELWNLNKSLETCRDVLDVDITIDC